MDPHDAFLAAHPFRWDLGPPAPAAVPPPPPLPLPLPPAMPPANAPRELEDLVAGYGVRASTVARISELGFTASTLLVMTDRELDDMTAALAGLFRWDLLIGERFGLRAALRAERGRLMALHGGRYHGHQSGSTVDGASQEVLSNERDGAASGGIGEDDGGRMMMVSGKKQKRKAKKARRKKVDGLQLDHMQEDDREDGGGRSESTESSAGGGGGVGGERQREHPFVVTEPGEVARAKKNGLDYLFHLYEQCRLFLLQVQSMAKLHGHKSSTKVTNQVFRYASKVGASYINKPKMRHYVHCYALHCLDEDASDALRRAFKARGENVGAWRQACYAPLVDIAARHGFDVDAVFAAHPRLAIWYVPTRLRQLCHQARSAHEAAAASNGAGGMPPPLPMF